MQQVMSGSVYTLPLLYFFVFSPLLLPLLMVIFLWDSIVPPNKSRRFLSFSLCWVLSLIISIYIIDAIDDDDLCLFPFAEHFWYSFSDLYTIQGWPLFINGHSFCITCTQICLMLEKAFLAFYSGTSEATAVWYSEWKHGILRRASTEYWISTNLHYITACQTRQSHFFK